MLRISHSFRRTSDLIKGKTMKEKISIIIFVLILGSILTAALVIANDFTAPIIAKNKELKTKISVLKGFGIEHSKDDAEKIFSENIEIVEKEDQKFYVSRNKELAFEFSGTGLWGPIHGILALQPDLETIKGITIIHQEETPGLGGRIAEKEFLDKFKGKKIVPEIRILPPDKVSKNNEVDAITGATLTCNAFEEILNGQSKKYIPLILTLPYLKK